MSGQTKAGSRRRELFTGRGSRLPEPAQSPEARRPRLPPWHGLGADSRESCSEIRQRCTAVGPYARSDGQDLEQRYLRSDHSNHKRLATEVRLGLEEGLAGDSVANCDKLPLISRERLIPRLGVAGESKLAEACRAVATAIDS